MLSIRDIRKSTGLSQKEFARQYHIPASTLQKWEQGIMSPAPYVIALLTDVIPETRKGLDQIKYKNETYYIDTASHTVSDSAGNMVRYDADIEAGKRTIWDCISMICFVICTNVKNVLKETATMIQKRTLYGLKTEAEF